MRAASRDSREIKTGCGDMQSDDIRTSSGVTRLSEQERFHPVNYLMVLVGFFFFFALRDKKSIVSL